LLAASLRADLKKRLVVTPCESPAPPPGGCFEGHEVVIQISAVAYLLLKELKMKSETIIKLAFAVVLALAAFKAIKAVADVVSMFSQPSSAIVGKANPANYR